MVASELKAMCHFKFTVEQFPPGYYCENGVMSRYYSYVNPREIYSDEIFIKYKLEKLMRRAINKRFMSDRKISCLLSGGLDSTLVCALVKKYYEKDLNTYSIGLKGATDLKYAQIAADYLKTNHTSVEVSEEEFLGAIRETIYMIESYDTTTVRASVGNYLISKYIKKNTEDTVLFCGDVSDELFASYKGFCSAPSLSELKTANKYMLKDIHYFDVLRCDRSISGASLEARVPFSDKYLIEFVMLIDPSIKSFGGDIIEKRILRETFTGYLPDELLYRKKEAFSDGVSSVERSWHVIIKEYVNSIISDEEYEIRKLNYSHNQPYDKESLHYREIFEEYYPNRGEIIPYFWKQPFSTEQDPSARELKDNDLKVDLKDEIKIL
jgi:asparagine synthase (glutamine-hydrolysing)